MTFFKLTPEYTSKLRKLKFTAAEWRLWSYLITLDPFGNRYQELPPMVDTLAECNMSKATFYRAIGKFQKANLFDFQAERIYFRNISGEGKISKIEQESQDCDKSLKNENLSLKNETGVSKMRLESQICENQPLEPSHSKASSPRQTNKTNKTNKTLSEDEREKFLQFGLEKAKLLPKPPALPEKWVWKNFEELYREFGSQKETGTPNQDWENHPKRDEWIAQIREGRPRFIVLGGPSEELEERSSFAEWAEQNNLIWGDESC